jgi:hypothetical protein
VGGVIVAIYQMATSSASMTQKPITRGFQNGELLLPKVTLTDILSQFSARRPQNERVFGGEK